MFGIGRQIGRHKHMNGRRHQSSQVIFDSSCADRQENSHCPLSELKENASGTIVELVGGCGACSRLMGLGLHRGSTVKVVRKGVNGPILIEVGDTRVGLGRGICRHIILDISESVESEKRSQKKPCSKSADAQIDFESLNSRSSN